ncbi:MAG: FHA domain-containing protein [Anaerolineales bacterium]|nr:FHA domain-containing protein [Anaerolineales bacterium]
MVEESALLVVRQGPYPDEEYRLTRQVTVMGRGPNNDIVFADPEISRQHAQIVLGEDGVYSIKDLGSTNGLFVNGRRVVGSAPLSSGDVVSLGESIVLGFYLPGAEPEDEDDTPTAEIPVVVPPAPPAEPAPAMPMTTAPPLPYAPAPYPAAPAPEIDDDGRLRRRLILGCLVLLVLIFLCTATLFFLDAYDNGRLLYCGVLRPFWEAILGPLGFAPACG